MFAISCQVGKGARCGLRVFNYIKQKYFRLTYDLTLRVKTHLCPFNYYIFCRVNTIFQLITSVLWLCEAPLFISCCKDNEKSPRFIGWLGRKAEAAWQTTTRTTHSYVEMNLDDFLMIRQMFANKLFLCFRTKVILDFIVA